MQKMSDEEFKVECDNLLEKYVSKCQKNYFKKKDYKSIAKNILYVWFKKFGPSLAELEILRKWTFHLSLLTIHL